MGRAWHILTISWIAVQNFFRDNADKRRYRQLKDKSLTRGLAGENSNTLRAEGCICLFCTLCFLSLSSLCRHICSHWTYKLLSRYILANVCLRLSQFFQLYFTQYMGRFVFSWPISLATIVRICVFYLIIIIKSEVWTVSHYFGWGHETMVCTLMSCYVLTKRERLNGSHS